MRSRKLTMTSMMALVTALAQPVAAQTLPGGGSVARGAVTIGAPSGGTVEITQFSARAVVNWQSFDIGTGGTVRFNQTTTDSAILNRVGGAQGSRIDGRIEANGQVFLVNPNGIAIGSGGVVDTKGGFVASTLDITDGDFMAGRLNFAGSAGAGKVANAGSISSANGLVALIGTSVSNTGTISANTGTAALGAATAATLDLAGDGFLQVTLPADATDAGGTPLIDQAGTITVRGGRVRLTAAVAADAVRRAINLSGTIEANAANGVSGDVLLQTVGGGDIGSSGTINASAARLDAAGSVGLSGARITADTVDVAAAKDITGQSGQISGRKSSRVIAGTAVNLNGVAFNQYGSEFDGTRIDITGDTVTLAGFAQMWAVGGLIRIGGAFRDGAADDGTAAYQRFGLAPDRSTGLPPLALARTVSINADFRGGADYYDHRGAAIVIASRDLTDVYGAGVETDSSLAISSRGAVNNFGTIMSQFGSSTFKFLNDLWVGAPTISIRNQMTGMSGSTLVLNQNDLRYKSDTTTIEAGDALDVRDGLNSTFDFRYASIPGVVISPDSFGDLSLRAGRSISLNGGIENGSYILSVATNVANANGGGQRAAGSAVLDATNARFGWSYSAKVADWARAIGLAATRSYFYIGDLSFSLQSGSDGGAGGLIKLGAIDRNAANGSGAPNSGNLALSATSASQIVFYGDVSLYKSPTSALFSTYGQAQFALSGPLAFRNDAVITADLAGLTWRDQNTTPITSYLDGRVGFSANYRIQAYDNTGGLITLRASNPDSLLPQGGTISAGSVNASGSLSNLTLTQLSDRAVIDWTSFSVSAGNSVTFVQPSSTSAILNRVGANGGTSAIGGSVTANGQVFLVNPNGIVITGTGAISTAGGFTASSLALTNSDFLGGSLKWAANANAAGITNFGTITASNAAIALLGGSIRGPGTIAAGSAGTVTLIAGGSGITDVGQASGGALRIGAQNVTIGATPGTSGLSLTPSGALGLFAGFSSVSIEAANDFTLSDGLSVPANSLAALSFSAGRNLLVSGVLQAGGAALSLTADSPTVALGVAGARGGGAATLDLTGATLTSAGSVGLTLGGGASGGLIKLAPMTAVGDLSIVASNGGAVRFGGNVTAAGTIALSGSLQFAADTVVSAPSLSWSNAPGDQVSGVGGSSFTAQAALVSGGTALFQGTLKNGVAARLDLGGFAPGYASIVYGDDDTLSAASALRLRSGSLATGDTLASLLAPGALTVTGIAPARRDVGTFAVTLAVGGSGPISTKAGYFFDLRTPATNSFTVTPRAITYQIGALQSIYGTVAAPVASLSGVLSGDSVAGSVTAFAGSTPVALAGGLGAGSYTLSVSSLTGTSAGNYAIAASGNSAGRLTVAPRAIGAAAHDASAIYGTAAILADATLTGVLAGDQVFATSALDIGGTMTAPADRLAAGSYTIAVTGLAGSAAANYTLGTRTNALLTVNPKLLQLSLGAGSYIYGSGAGIAALNGVLIGDALGLAGTLDGAATTLTGAPEALALPERTAAEAHQLAITGLNGAAAANYALDPVSPRALAFTIAPKPITFATDVIFGTYGDFASLIGPDAGVRLSGVLTGDDVTATGAADTGAGLAAVGTYTSAGSWDLRVLLGGSSAANYVTAATGNSVGRLTLARRHITASIADTQSTYGKLPDFTVTLNNMVAGDDVHGVGSLLDQMGYVRSFDNRLEVGTYRITSDESINPSGTRNAPLTGSAAANYIFDYGTDGVLTVAPKTIAAAFTGTTSVYGAHATRLALTGVVAGDTLTPIAALDGAATAITADGAAYGLDARLTAGTHQIEVVGLSGARAGNYTLAPSVAAITIAPRPLTWSVADATSIYGNLAAPAVTLANALTGDSLGATFLANGSALAAGLRVGSYTIGVDALTGSDAGNYTLAASGNQAGLLSVTPRPISYCSARRPAPTARSPRRPSAWTTSSWVMPSPARSLCRRMARA